MKAKTYDVVLVERLAGDGIAPHELGLFAKYFEDDAELIPIEIDNKYGDSSAMGFITVAAEQILFSIGVQDMKNAYNEMTDYIANIMSDVNNVHEDNEYEYAGVKIFLAWQIY